jgi:hypothetical protein
LAGSFFGLRPAPLQYAQLFLAPNQQRFTGPQAIGEIADNRSVADVDREGVRIGVARDEAFSFIYPANVDLLRRMGAELAFFSALEDSALPVVDSLWLPGGYPELHLDRRLVDRRIWPAIDINSSGTRREELLLDPKELELVYRLRRVLSDMNPVESVELLKGRLEKVPSNAQFLMSMNLD